MALFPAVEDWESARERAGVATSGPHGGTVCGEGLRRRGHRVRTEHAGAPLVVVERLGDLGVQGMGGGEFDAPGDGQRQQSRAAGRGAGGGEGARLLGGEHVQQRGRRDQPGAGQRVRREAGEITAPGLGGDTARPPPNAGRRRPRSAGGTGHGRAAPSAGRVEQRGEPAPHRAGAAAHVVHDQPVRPAREVGEADAERIERIERPRDGIGGLAEPQPLRRVARRVVGVRGCGPGGVAKAEGRSLGGGAAGGVGEVLGARPGGRWCGALLAGPGPIGDPGGGPTGGRGGSDGLRGLRLRVLRLRGHRHTGQVHAPPPLLTALGRSRRSRAGRPVGPAPGITPFVDSAASWGPGCAGIAPVAGAVVFLMPPSGVRSPAGAVPRPGSEPWPPSRSGPHGGLVPPP